MTPLKKYIFLVTDLILERAQNNTLHFQTQIVLILKNHDLIMVLHGQI